MKKNSNKIASEIKLFDSERKYLENLLNRRFHFYLLFASFVLFSIFSTDLEKYFFEKTIAAVFGFLISVLISFSVHRTHNLASRVLNKISELDSEYFKIKGFHYHPFPQIKKSLFFIHANLYLVVASYVLSAFFFVISMLLFIKLILKVFM